MLLQLSKQIADIRVRLNNEWKLIHKILTSSNKATRIVNNKRSSLFHTPVKEHTRK